MSSVHSQTSEVDVPPISATKLKGGTQNGSDTSIVSVKSTITFEKTEGSSQNQNYVGTERFELILAS